MTQVHGSPALAPAPSPPKTLRLGTRGSALALAQAHETRDRLIKAWSLAPEAIEIVEIHTSGDKIQDRPLVDIGGKGLFTKEIEEALLDGRIDAAVHSLKDVPTFLPDGLELAVVLEREDPRDVLICPGGARRLADLPPGAVLGTSSPRRRAQVLLARPDLQIRDFRGNVQTRLRKLAEGQADATLLAAAGLRRLGQADLAADPVPVDEMLPAAAQGVIGIEIRSRDAWVREWLAPLNHTPSLDAVRAERAVLAVLDGSCRTPIAAHARIDGDRMRIDALVVDPDSLASASGRIDGAVAEAAALGQTLGERLRREAPRGMF